MLSEFGRQFERQSQSAQSDDDYDTAQVCPNGHVINAYASSVPASNKKYCDRCGEATLTNCSNCNLPIQGRYNGGWIASPHWSPPRFCHNCGAMFPWTKLRIEAARDLVEELQLSEEDKQLMKRSIEDIVKDTPSTQVASSRFKRLLAKGGEELGGMFRDLLVDIASETAKKLLFPQ